MVEMIRYGGEEIKKEVWRIVMQMWMAASTSEDGEEARDWPDIWKKAIQIPLWKAKGDKADRNTWTGITLLSVGTKLVARIVLDRIQEWARDILPE